MGTRDGKFAPMLAVKCDPEKIKYPVYGSPKFDGLRACNYDGRLLSRTLIMIPNKELCTLLGQPVLHGMDGELIAGSPTAKDVFQRTTSTVMTVNASAAAVKYYVFDCHSHYYEFENRYVELQRRVEWFHANLPHIPIVLVEQELLHNVAELNAYEERQLDLGYEGIIVRSPGGMYKYGRSTERQGWMLKVKRFEDSEAEIIGFEELMHNDNALGVSNTGHAKRSSHMENQRPGDTLGALCVRDLKTGCEFRIGSGFDQELRKRIWTNRPHYHGQVVTYKHFPIGRKDLPRHPIFKGFRDRRDFT